MKKFIKYVLSTLLVSLILLSVTVVSIIGYPQDVFHSSYQSLIQDKFRILNETDEPKIIMVAGSSSSYGLDQNMLEDATGYKVANLGLHAGFFPLFYTELSKANINEGDIVLLGYEYEWFGPGSFNGVNADLVMSGIDNHWEMYKYLPIKTWPSLLGYLFTYASKKNAYKDPTTESIYSRSAFDPNTAQVLIQRNFVQNLDYTGHDINLKDTVIGDDVVKYLTEYKKFVENQGASIYFVAPPLLQNCVSCSLEDFDKLAKLEEEKIGIPFISNPSDYLYPYELIYDSIYHCTSEGEKIRTQELISDLLNARAIDHINIDSPIINNSIDEQKFQPTYTNTLEVGEGYPYTTINDAVAAASDGNRIFIHNGTYTESINPGVKFLTFEGESRNGTIVTYPNGNYAVPPFNIAKGVVKNLTVHATQQELVGEHYAYAMHIDSEYSSGSSLYIENVHFINDTYQVVGIGLHADFTLIFKNCDFDANDSNAFYCHDDNTENSKSQNLIVKNCTFRNASASTPTIQMQSQEQERAAATVLWQRNVVVNRTSTDLKIGLYHWNPKANCDKWLASSDWTLDEASCLNSCSELNENGEPN